MRAVMDGYCEYSIFDIWASSEATVVTSTMDCKGGFHPDVGEFLLFLWILRFSGLFCAALRRYSWYFKFYIVLPLLIFSVWYNDRGHNVLAYATLEEQFYKNIEPQCPFIKNNLGTASA